MGRLDPDPMVRGGLQTARARYHWAKDAGTMIGFSIGSCRSLVLDQVISSSGASVMLVLYLTTSPFSRGPERLMLGLSLPASCR